MDYNEAVTARACRIAFLLTCTLLIGTAAAHWMPGQYLPLARLIKNMEKRVENRPGDASAQYVLGRLHSLGYASTADKVEVYDPDGDVGFAVDNHITVTYGRKDAKLSPEARAHLIASIKHYSRACYWAPKDGVYWLGYGWMLEQAARWASELPSSAPGWPTVNTKEGWTRAAIGAYRNAFLESHEKDAGTAMILEVQVTGDEAIKNLRRLCKSIGTPLEGDLLVQIKKCENAMQMPTAITPIVIPLGPGTPYREIDNPSARVGFDLDGLGMGSRWTWITPKAAFLVWNQRGDGIVRSGRELFGSATFWMFFKNGYAALDSLDDNGDGTLTGRELRSIAVWHDANTNGRSDSGEVCPLASYSIVGIRTRPQGRNGQVWFNKQGIVRQDGRTLPTYDWIATARPR